MKVHYLKNIKKCAVVDLYFMLYFTDFILLPDTSEGIRFSLDKCVVEYHKLKKLTCKDMNRKFTKKDIENVNRHRKMCSISLRSKMFNASVRMV